MYEAAEQEINKGLSLTARIILAVFAALFGVVMLLIAPPTENAYFFYLFGSFCILISIACVVQGRSRQFIGSLIGTSLFIISLWYLYGQVTGGSVLSSSRSEPSITNAILFLIAFGLPGIAYTYKAKFGVANVP